MSKSIAILGTLDTKGEEVKYLADIIKARGHTPVVFDVGVLGQPSFAPTVSNDQIAKAGGSGLDELRAPGPPGKEARAMETMARGASVIVEKMRSKGQIDGVLALGGTAGTSLALTVVKTLPIGFPKLVLTTVAFSPFIPNDIIDGDLMMIRWVSGLRGINNVNRSVLETAAGAIIGAVETVRKQVPSSRPVLGLTATGGASAVYSPNWLEPSLRARGYELLMFHALGGGRELERLVAEGRIDAVLDLWLSEITTEIAGAVRLATHRLEAAGKKGIPQIVSVGTGGIMWPPAQPLPPRMRNRPVREHNWLVSVVPTTARERAQVARVIAERLNRSTGPVAVVIPLRSITPQHEIVGAAQAMSKVLKANLRQDIQVVELDASMNDRIFTDTVLELLDRMMANRSLRTGAPSAS